MIEYMTMFLWNVWTLILNEMEITPRMSVLVETGNCTWQYRSAKSFYDVQEQANKYDKNLIHLYGIAGHGKGQMDRVGL